MKPQQRAQTAANLFAFARRQCASEWLEIQGRRVRPHG
jgi:hypothetical protein